MQMIVDNGEIEPLSVDKGGQLGVYSAEKLLEVL